MPSVACSQCQQHVGLLPSASDDGPGAEIGLPGALAKAYDAVGDWLVAHPAPAWLVNSPLKTRLTEILAGPSYDPEASLAREASGS